MDNVLVSVIIPVYNGEKYLEKCIESLINQTLQECEFIFINDGSSDKSKEIIEKYKINDERIILINQENQGVSVARNKGLEIATGKYIGFVDADDYVEKDMYDTLYQAAVKDDIDVVISNLEIEIEGKKVKSNYEFKSNIQLGTDYIKNYILSYFLKKEDLNTVCSKLYKKSIISRNNIQFPKDIELGEDGIFNMIFFSNCNKAKYIDYIGYNYREVLGSATRNLNDKDYFKRALEVYQMDISSICKINMDFNYIQKLKSIKLIDSVISYIYIYFTNKDICFKKKYSYIKNMINNELVVKALKLYEIKKLSRYEKFIIKMMKNKCTLGLYMATKYSEFRNN